jgi:hypothetical protein
MLMIVRNPIRLWDLPEDVLFHVVSCAAPASRRTGVDSASLHRSASPGVVRNESKELKDGIAPARPAKGPGRAHEHAE